MLKTDTQTRLSGRVGVRAQIAMFISVQATDFTLLEAVCSNVSFNGLSLQFPRLPCVEKGAKAPPCFIPNTLPELGRGTTTEIENLHYFSQ